MSWQKKNIMKFKSHIKIQMTVWTIYDIQKSFLFFNSIWLEWTFLIVDKTDGNEIIAGDVNVFLNDEMKGEINVMIAEKSSRKYELKFLN